MQIEPVSTELIERYLDARGLRFYRDGDGEHYLLLLSSEHCRLHVQIGLSGRDRSVLAIRVSPADHYAAGERGRLMELVNEWNRETRWPKAFVWETSTPGRVGVVGENSYPLTDGIHFDAFATFIDVTVRCATDLFDKIAQSLELPSAETLETWLQAG
jgi:hypothetical protein